LVRDTKWLIIVYLLAERKPLIAYYYNVEKVLFKMECIVLGADTL